MSAPERWMEVSWVDPLARRRVIGFVREKLGSRRTWYRLLTWLLVYLVLAGGIYPAIYESQLPHDHLFIGGPPPTDWENHAHENSLFLLLGAPGNSQASSADAPFLPIVADHADVPGRVVSVYPGVSSGVLSLFTVTLLAMVLGLMRAPSRPTSRIEFPQSRLPYVLVDGPATPPPRFV